MNILLLGSGGREHTLAWKISQSSHCSKLFIAPGNAGTAQFGENINMSATDFNTQKIFCINNNINLKRISVSYLYQPLFTFFLMQKRVTKNKSCIKKLKNLNAYPNPISIG